MTAWFVLFFKAGLEGIEKKYALPDPMEKNLYHLSNEERKKLGINSLPDSLGEAVTIDEESSIIKKALGGYVFSRFIELTS